MEYFARLTVALCLDAVDRGLLRYARLVRDLAPVPLVVSFVHVVSPDDGPSAPQARAAVEAAVAEHFGDATATTVEIPTGSPLDQLLESAAVGGSDVVMVGHRTGASGRRSLSRRLAMKAPCSVWMVPEGSPVGISRVMASVDFSPPSARAASLATLIASRAGLSSCTLVHVIEPTVLGVDAEARAEVRRWFERFLAPLDRHGIEMREVVRESGVIPRALLASAEEEGADLVVMGTRGHGRSAAVLLGSESEGVLQTSTIPVLVTKERGERIGILRALLERDLRSSEPRFG